MSESETLVAIVGFCLGALGMYLVDKRLIDGAYEDGFDSGVAVSDLLHRLCGDDGEGSGE